MINIYRERFRDIPVLTVVNSEKRTEPLPIVTYIHGFTSAKEHNLPQAFLLAEKGYRVILPDAIHHGDRGEGMLSDQEVEFEFWNIVIQTLRELPVLRDELNNRGLIKDDRFGLAGTSMGGIVTSAALTQFPWVKTAAILMGSPNITGMARATIEQFRGEDGTHPIAEEEINQLMEQLSTIDLASQMDKLGERPVFFWHGEEDKVVPFNLSYHFYERAIDHYKDPEKIRFLREVGRDHKVTRFAIKETVKWFEMHL